MDDLGETLKLIRDHYRVDREQYPDGSAMPEYPALVLGTHVIAKGVQVGSVVGLTAGSLLWLGLLLRGRSPSIRRTVVRGANSGVVLGGAGATGLAGWKIADIESNDGSMAGLDDRGYRLTKNRFSKAWDRQTVWGGMFGIALGSVFAGLPLGGFSLGVAATSALFIADQVMVRKYNTTSVTEMMMEELEAPRHAAVEQLRAAGGAVWNRAKAALDK